MKTFHWEYKEFGWSEKFHCVLMPFADTECFESNLDIKNRVHTLETLLFLVHISHIIHINNYGLFLFNSFNKSHDVYPSFRYIEHYIPSSRFIDINSLFLQKLQCSNSPKINHTSFTLIVYVLYFHHKVNTMGMWISTLFVLILLIWNFSNILTYLFGYLVNLQVKLSEVNPCF